MEGARSSDTYRIDSDAYRYIGELKTREKECRRRRRSKSSPVKSGANRSRSPKIVALVRVVINTSRLVFVDA